MRASYGVVFIVRSIHGFIADAGDRTLANATYLDSKQSHASVIPQVVGQGGEELR
jgi:hypothetical protein